MTAFLYEILDDFECAVDAWIDWMDDICDLVSGR